MKNSLVAKFYNFNRGLFRTLSNIYNGALLRKYFLTEVLVLVFVRVSTGNFRNKREKDMREKIRKDKKTEQYRAMTMN